jgi:IS30 family transposase
MFRRRLSEAEQWEIRQRLEAGETFEQIAEGVGCDPKTAQRIMVRTGGLKPRLRRRSPLRLSEAEREDISRGLTAGESMRAIARTLKRAPSTVAREVKRNRGRRYYRAWDSELAAKRRARRPKQAKLATNRRLRFTVELLMLRRWSPEQIATWLKVEYPSDPTMQVSHETIYQSLFVQGRGALRKELTAYLRTKRPRRGPPVPSQRGKIKDKVMISERPAEAEDRAVPGHWEGDLLNGKGNRSAIATLVERRSRYVMLIALPDGKGAEVVREALTAKIKKLPAELRKTLTWDQGKEMAEHVKFTVATKVQVYFCDPKSPWQRGSNENTNGLLRDYFPKDADLNQCTQAELDWVAKEMNTRPRKTLGWKKPAEVFWESVALTA